MRYNALTCINEGIEDDQGQLHQPQGQPIGECTIGLGPTLTVENQTIVHNRGNRLLVSNDHEHDREEEQPQAIGVILGTGTRRQLEIQRTVKDTDDDVTYSGDDGGTTVSGGLQQQAVTQGLQLMPRGRVVFHHG